jgi:hypothetical protein
MDLRVEGRILYIQKLVTILSTREAEILVNVVDKPKFVVYMGDIEYNELRMSVNNLLPFTSGMFDIDTTNNELRVNGHSIYRVREKGHTVKIFQLKEDQNDGY